MSKTELRLGLTVLRDRGFSVPRVVARLQRFLRHDHAERAIRGVCFEQPSIRQWTQEEILRREA